MIADRFAPALAVLVALTLVPVVLHGYLGATVDDGRTTAAIPSRIGDYSSVPTDRDAGWGGRRFESHDWFERRYVSPTDDVVATVLRSYDVKKLYHHPELDVAYGTPFMNHRIAHLPGRPDVPLHILTTDTDGGPVAFYVLLHGREFIADPVRFQLRTAFESLWTRRQAMTLFFVRDPVTARVQRGAAEALPAATLLASLVASFEHASASPVR